MEIPEIYIKQCDCPEIQEDWPVNSDLGDYYHDKRDGEVFNLGKMMVHFSKKTSWMEVAQRYSKKEKKGGGFATLESVSVHAHDLYTVLQLLMEKTEHHFLRRDE